MKQAYIPIISLSHIEIIEATPEAGRRVFM
jgi:hypothetical protein